MTNNPLAAQHRHRLDRRFELDALKRLTDAEIMAIAEAVPGFDGLQKVYGFHIDRSEPDTLQMSFGHRSMGRMTIDRRSVATETGPTIVYSFGHDGTFSTILYPAKSDLARVFEDLLFLDISEASAAQLIARMPQDLSDLVAYGHVSSIDLGEPATESADRGLAVVLPPPAGRQVRQAESRPGSRRHVRFRRTHPDHGGVHVGAQADRLCHRVAASSLARLGLVRHSNATALIRTDSSVKVADLAQAARPRG